MPQGNLLFLLIDTFRYDVVSNPDACCAFMPNLAKLIQEGDIRPVTTNSHTTKFVLPSIFTATYPLDFGGYNYGIQKRTKSFIETASEAGCDTLVYLTHDLDGPHFNLEKGSRISRSFYDKRLLIESDLRYFFDYELKKFHKGIYSKIEICEIIQKRLKPLLCHMAESANRSNDVRLNNKLRVFSLCDVKRINAELELLQTDPYAVIEKLNKIPVHFFYHFLGDRTPSPLKVRWMLAKDFIVSKLQTFINKKLKLDFRLLHPRFPVVASEVYRDAFEKILNMKQNWLAYIHVMDVHDSRLVKRPWHVLSKVRFLPEVRRARRKFGSDRAFFYDLAIRQLDHDIGNFLAKLDASGLLENTNILVTGDHGGGWNPRRHAGLAGDFGFRSYIEHLTVPLIIKPRKKSDIGQMIKGGFVDSKDVAATSLDLLDIMIPEEFNASSAYKKTRQFVVSENAGRGNAAIHERDLYFTISSSKFVVMAKLVGDKLSVIRAFDVVNDPHQTECKIGFDEHAEDIDSCLDFLFSERKNLLNLRGVNRSDVVLNIGDNINEETGEDFSAKEFVTPDADDGWQ